MTDIEKIPRDPFGLIGDNWPPQSESDYTSVATKLTNAATTARNQSTSVTQAAAGMPDDLVGQTGTAAENSYSTGAQGLTTMEFNLTSLSTWMTDCAGRVTDAKTQINTLVITGTKEINTAIADEMERKKPSPSSEELKTQYRNDIAGVKDSLKTELEAVTDGELTQPAFVRAPAATPENPDAPRKAVDDAISGIAPTDTNPVTLPPMPTAVQNVVNATPTDTPDSTPSPSNPFLPPTAPSAPATQAPAPTAPNAPAPTEGAPPPTSPTSPETSTDSRTATSPEKPTTPEEKAPEASPLSVPSISVPDPTGIAQTVADAVPTALAAAEPAIAAGTPPTAQFAPASVVPQGTGLTPGVPVAPPVMGTPPASTGLGAMVPPNAPQTPQSTASPGGLPPAAPQPQAANQPAPQPLRSPDGTLIAQGVAQNQAQGDTPKKGGEAIGLAALDTAVVADLTDDRELHTVLALLRDQYQRVGWDTPLAVARIHREDESVIAWTTADAVSLWAPGVTVPEGILPIDMVPGITPHLGLQGLRRPGAKLAALLLDTGWETDFVLTTESQDTMEGGPPSRRQPQEDAAQITAQGSLLLPSISRADAASSLWDTGDPMSAMTMLLLGDAKQPMYVSIAGSALRSLRWTESQPEGYLETLTTWYRADAVAAMADADMAETAYPAAQYAALNDALQPTQ